MYWMAPGSKVWSLAGRGRMTPQEPVRLTRISGGVPVEADVVRREVVVELFVDEVIEEAMERVRARQVDLREEVPLQNLKKRDGRVELFVGNSVDLADEVGDALEHLRAAGQSTTDEANLARGHVDRGTGRGTWRPDLVDVLVGVVHEEVIHSCSRSGGPRQPPWRAGPGSL